MNNHASNALRRRRRRKEHLQSGRPPTGTERRLTAVAVGVRQHRLQALRGRHHSRVGAVLAAHFPVHAAEDLRRQMERFQDLVFPLVYGDPVLTDGQRTAVS